MTSDHAIEANSAVDSGAVTLLRVYSFRNLKYGSRSYTASEAEYTSVFNNRHAELAYRGMAAVRVRSLGGEGEVVGGASTAPILAERAVRLIPHECAR